MLHSMRPKARALSAYTLALPSTRSADGDTHDPSESCRGQRLLAATFDT
jgi:hypothetical protein